MTFATPVMTRRRFQATALASLVAGPAALRNSFAQGGRILLGQSSPFTGPSGDLGVQFNAGAKVFFELLNARGGVGGRGIELVSLDDGYEPDRCAANTERLIGQDVLALFGYYGTNSCRAAMPMAIKAGVPFFAPSNGSMTLREPHNRLVFHMRASYEDETAAMINQLDTIGLKKVAVFYQNDGYGEGGMTGVSKALAAQSRKPVSTATIERNSAAVTPDMVRTLLAAKPDAIIQICTYKAAAAMIREARKAGFGGQFYNVSLVGTRPLAEELGKLASGVIVTQVLPSPHAGMAPLSREFQAAVAKHGKKVDINYTSFEGYVAAKLFADGLARAGGRITRETLVSGLESIGSADYGGFPISLSSTKHVASRFVEKSMMSGDGKFRV
ncbi:ABC transporter substrate-binding protein [Ottowia testudinis]|uniref:ABC transporter substrate-binding protein n=1 Tax=Ottowia testudinis TaxID=2816950 RepID=A0A975CLA2_9BURK|nr:ABC transporter substrate-binding protein [Ottowia testudinis]QTD47092.1 ABC transporter substrate-binding protein [Ottowia testudinis]